jgi:nucleoside-diphosphate-sugar epimerase
LHSTARLEANLRKRIVSSRSVLVIGGTGFLGRKIAEAFVERGDRVAVLSRGERAGVSDVEGLSADRHNLAALRGVLGDRTFDVVVDNIAYVPEDVASVLTTLQDRIGHYLMTSSSAVYADRFVRRPLRESDADLKLQVPVDAPDPFHSRQGHAYANAKRAAEALLRESSVPWTVLRPPVILGADDRTQRVWWFVQRLLDGGPILIPDWGPGRIFQVAWADDVARAFCCAAGHASAYGKAYNVAQAEIYTADSWIQTCARVLGVSARYNHMPENELRSVGLEGYALPIAGRPFGHVLLDLSAASRDFGFEPRSEDVWLARTISGCAANPPTADSAHYAQRDLELRASAAAVQQSA